MKFFLILFISIFSLQGSSLSFIKGMNYQTVYEKALEKAKDENKILMMIATTQSCPWCRKMERQTLKKEEINSVIQSNFVPLVVDQDLKNFPQQYEVKVVPTIYFINPKDGSVVNKVLGYKNKKDFKKILAEVKVK